MSDNGKLGVSLSKFSGWVNLVGREEGLLYPTYVVKEFVTKFCQQTLEYRARDSIAPKCTLIFN